MKLKIGNKVFLQKYDISYIIHNLNSYPCGILQEAFSNGNDNIFYMNGSVDGFNFSHVYAKPENTEWLMEQDWILDYDEYAKLSLTELKNLQTRLKTERSTSIREFNSKSEKYRKKFFKKANDEFSRLAHKIISLDYLIQMRQGTVQITLPNEYQSKSTISHAGISKKKSNFFARLFSRSAQ